MLNTDDGILTLLKEGKLLAQCKFRDSELYVCATLFACFPNYAPLEELFAVLTEKSVAECVKLLDEALEQDHRKYSNVTSFVRQIITRCRKLLLPFGIQIHAIDKTGYELLPIHQVPPEPPQRRRSAHFSLRQLLYP